MGGPRRMLATAACAAVALLASSCGGSSGTTPAGSADPAVVTPSGLPGSGSASASASPTQVDRPTEVSRDSGARADVPTVEIMAQLARRAERIAKRLPQAPVPAGIDRGTNRALGYQLLLEFGFPADQWRYLDALWARESGWNHLAENPSSGAYGIPQSLPASKMAVVGGDWRTNPETQIRWGLAYIAARYGSAQKAWEHSERVGWY
ncbi:transglycosylase SLT domain-containing protein [Nocardioides sp. WV_118_6]